MGQLGKTETLTQMGRLREWVASAGNSLTKGRNCGNSANII